MGFAKNLLVDFPQRRGLRLHDPRVAGQGFKGDFAVVLLRVAGARDDLNHLFIECLNVQLIGWPAIRIRSLVD